MEAADPALRISARSFDRLAQYITGELGIQMPPTKVSLIQSRLLRRVRHLGLASLDDYCDHFFSDSAGQEERVHFVNAITTNKTDFFREPQHFNYLTQTALPTLAAEHRLAVWSAACSSGEEPYTLAMVLSEYGAARPGFDFRILATDVSTKVLKMAADGIYTRQQIEPVPNDLRRKYLLNGKAGQNSLVRITPALRRMVSFHQLNFMDADYGVREMFDVIFCRNVMIYFNRATQQEVIAKLCRNLRRGGYLFVSHSESLSGLDLPLAAVGASCFRRIEGKV
jgi:chemotaxis protein methyltransferase CheR